MNKFIVGILTVILSIGLAFGTLEAKPGGFSGGSRSSSFSSGSRSSSFSSRPSSSSSFSRPSSSSSWGGSSSKSSIKSPTTTSKSVDSKSASSTRTGSTYTTKAQAESAFKSKFAGSTAKGGKFTSYYDKEPATRPTHIPKTTTVGNTNVNVNYNSQYGGYGYMHPTLGTWIMYDMLSDAAMISAMSHNHGYVAAAPGTVVHTNSGSSFLYFITFLGVVVVGFIILTAFFNTPSNKW